MKLRAVFLTCCIVMLLDRPLAAVSPEIQKLVISAFSEKDTVSMDKGLQKAASKASLPEDKKYVYTALASLSERSGNPADAFEQYRTAALAIPGTRDDSLFLDAVRCALAANDTETAGEMVRAVLLSSFDEGILLRARVYSAWIQLASGDRASALELLRTFAASPQFNAYAPAILFTLWWSGRDTVAGKTLQETYHASPEAAAARGEILVGPSAFWYLMERDGVPGFAVADKTPADEAPPAKTPEETANPTKTSEPLPAVSGTGAWQQTGFFRNRENAESLAEVLRQRGFSPVVREDTRPSGTVYYAVLVPDDGTTAARLKDAGIDSYPVK